MDVTVHIICSICVLACCPWAVGLNLAHNGIKFVMKEHSWRIPTVCLHLIFVILQFEISSLMNLIFGLFQTWILQATTGRKIQFKLGKKSSSSNLIFQKNSTQNLKEFYWDKLIASDILDIFQFKLKKYLVETLMHK